MHVSRAILLSIFISPDTKQNFSLIYLTISKSDVLLNAYPRWWRSLRRWLVTCLPAIYNLSKLDFMIFPLKTGIQWVTPSPLSKSIAVSMPYANKDIRACIPYWILLTWNFSNMISIMPTLLETGFIMASVMNTEVPFELLTPI